MRTDQPEFLHVTQRNGILIDLTVTSSYANRQAMTPSRYAKPRLVIGDTYQPRGTIAQAACQHVAYSNKMLLRATRSDTNIVPPRDTKEPNLNYK